MAGRSEWWVSSFYKFCRLTSEEVQAHQTWFGSYMESSRVLGLVVLAEEGINATVAGERGAVDVLKTYVEAHFGEVRFKDSVSEMCPFHRVSVDIRREIVASKNDGLPLPPGDDHHLSPSEWHAMLAGPNPKTVIDTRNRYETQLGMFEGAVDPDLKSFGDWGGYLDRAEIPRDQPVMIYCTGGIRCEKAIFELRSRGFEEVYQLRDGILGYLEQFPEGKYRGECFVFDDRVALDAHLNPTTKAGICPGCGLPATNKFDCAWCGSVCFCCDDCRPVWEGVCSKTCRDRIRRHGCPTA
ncbi:rhodanese-related sulfurtransferase [Fimbriimonas ginsengisoli]|nr:rhodanese-like domain-containing protein [Fimbriimonas ginsengisoli]